MTLYGWDASDFDWARGPMDLGAAKAAGVTFFTHKATEGTSVRHTHYGEALNRARAAGIEFLGPYIVPRTPGSSIKAQVDYFLTYVNTQTPWWRDFPGFFFQVDTEHWGYDQVSPATGEAVCAALRERTGRWVVHYAPKWAYGNTIPGSTPLWASDYNGNPALPLQTAYTAGDAEGDNDPAWNAYSGRVPVFWQFGSRCIIGRQPSADGNAFRGSLADLRALITGSATPGQEDEMALLVQNGDEGSDKGKFYVLSGGVAYPAPDANSIGWQVSGRYYNNGNVGPSPLAAMFGNPKTTGVAPWIETPAVSIGTFPKPPAGGSGSGGDCDLDPVLAAIAGVSDQVTALTPEIRDAVADLGEGGAKQVRADE